MPRARSRDAGEPSVARADSGEDRADILQVGRLFDRRALRARQPGVGEGGYGKPNRALCTIRVE
jgi:hypothetical protein